VESRKRFSEAFEAINGHFKDLSGRCSVAARAKCGLTDETNIANRASILSRRLREAAPKRPVTFGGEKIAHAMALLVAIFITSRARFSLSTKVDARWTSRYRTAQRA